MIETVLTLLQLCDSSFPIGSFSHSFGLETYISKEQVFNKGSFKNWLEAYLNDQLIPTDGLALRLSYEALENKQIEKIWALDRLLTVHNISRETRDGTKKIGERMLEMISELYLIDTLKEYQSKIRHNQSFGHPALVFSIVAFYLGIHKHVALTSYLYASPSNLIQNGVRGIPLGQTAGQLLLNQLKPQIVQSVQRIESLQETDLGNMAPGLEIAQMRHEFLHVRLFMS